MRSPLYSKQKRMIHSFSSTRSILGFRPLITRMARDRSVGWGGSQHSTNNNQRHYLNGLGLRAEKKARGEKCEIVTEFWLAAGQRFQGQPRWDRLLQESPGKSPLNMVSSTGHAQPRAHTADRNRRYKTQKESESNTRTVLKTIMPTIKR